MFKISSSKIRQEWKKGRIVAVEFQNRLNVKIRAIVQGLPKAYNEVETLYGNVEPKELYSFDNVVEAQKYINGL